jgi:hypothetical protein
MKIWQKIDRKRGCGFYENLGYVLIYKDGQMSVATYSGDCDMWFDCFDHVVAGTKERNLYWMSLPSPPETETNDG